MSVIGLDELHATLVAHWTRITRLDPGRLAVGLWRVLVLGPHVGPQSLLALTQQGATLGQLGVAMAVGEEAEVADLMQALGQNMQALCGESNYVARQP